MATPLGDISLYRFIYYIFVSVVELDLQALLTIRLPILSKNIVHYDVRWASRRLCNSYKKKSIYFPNFP